MSNIDPLEFQWKPRQSLYIDLLEDWTTDQLYDYVTSHTNYLVDDAHGCGFQVKDIRMVPTLPSIDPETYDVKTMINWGNATPKGAVIDLSSEKANEVAKPAWQLLRILFPNLAYTQCRLMRGKISERIIEPSGARGDQLVIILWKKRDLKKRLYMAVCDSFDFTGFDPGPWTMLMFLMQMVQQFLGTVKDRTRHQLEDQYAIILAMKMMNSLR